MNFEDIKSTLEKSSGPSGRPMIVNRGSQGSPSSSIELLADDLLTTSPFGCTGTCARLLRPPSLPGACGIVLQGLTSFRQNYLGLLPRGWCLKLSRAAGSVRSLALRLNLGATHFGNGTFISHI